MLTLSQESGRAELAVVFRILYPRGFEAYAVFAWSHCTIHRNGTSQIPGLKTT